jgi:acyl-ACP thioesterase
MFPLYESKVKPGQARRTASATVTAVPIAAPDLVPVGPGRRYPATRVVRLGDVLPSGRVRLDAVARYLQDIASDDGSDAAIDRDLAWVVRRSGLRVYRRPRHGQVLDMVTWASGTGSRWAERRTTVSAAGHVAVEAAALWVCVDVATLRPARLSQRFWEMYGEAAGGRSVSSRLLHPDPPPATVAVGRPWPLRLADLDLFDHVNNAVTWAALEDEVARVAPEARIEWADVEYHRPIDRDTEVVLASRIEGSTMIIWLLANDNANADANADPKAGGDTATITLASAAVGLESPNGRISR